METKLIRFSEQSAYNFGIDERNPKKYVEGLGMKVIQYSYSSFGQCYFMEVENYVDCPNKIYKLMSNNPKTFKFSDY